MTPLSPAIVCLGYNRPASLARLLRSLAMARYAEPAVPLVISLDHGGGGIGLCHREGTGRKRKHAGLL